jgi:hypothetical protein
MGLLASQSVSQDNTIPSPCRANFYPTTGSGLPLLSFPLFSTCKPQGMRPDFGDPVARRYQQRTSTFASPGFGYPRDGFHSVKPTRSYFVPRALVRFSLQRFEAFE